MEDRMGSWRSTTEDKKDPWFPKERLFMQGCKTKRCSCRKGERQCGAGCECRGCTNFSQSRNQDDDEEEKIEEEEEEEGEEEEEEEGEEEEEDEGEEEIEDGEDTYEELMRSSNLTEGQKFTGN